MILNKEDLKNKFILINADYCTKSIFKKIKKKFLDLGFPKERINLRYKDLSWAYCIFTQYHPYSGELQVVQFGYSEMMPPREEILLGEFLEEPNDRIFIETCVIDYLADMGFKADNVKFKNSSDDNNKFRVTFSFSTEGWCRMDFLGINELLEDLKTGNTFLGEYIILGYCCRLNEKKYEFYIDLKKDTNKRNSGYEYYENGKREMFKQWGKAKNKRRRSQKVTLPLKMPHSNYQVAMNAPLRIHTITEEGFYFDKRKGGKYEKEFEYCVYCEIKKEDIPFSKLNKFLEYINTIATKDSLKFLGVPEKEGITSLFFSIEKENLHKTFGLSKKSIVKGFLILEDKRDLNGDKIEIVLKIINIKENEEKFNPHLTINEVEIPYCEQKNIKNKLDITIIRIDEKMLKLKNVDSFRMGVKSDISLLCVKFEGQRELCVPLEEIQDLTIERIEDNE